MEVFIVTVIFSLGAYVWIFYVLYDEVVETWEGFLTLFFFFLLLLTSYLTDRICQCKHKSRKSESRGNEIANAIEDLGIALD